MKFNWVHDPDYDPEDERYVALKDGIKLHAFLPNCDADIYKWLVEFVNGSPCISLSGESITLQQAKGEAERAFIELLGVQVLLANCKLALSLYPVHSRLAKKLGELLDGTSSTH